MSDLPVYTRSGDADLEPFEKAVPLPHLDDLDPARHAWADARFATDIMAEHALFFAMLMPPETASKEREESLRFSRTFADLHTRIDTAGPPERMELRAFTREVTEEIKPFIDYKAEMAEAQSSGRLHSLVWPLFFDHTRHEAER
jgi:hypothetical protein